jgi:hypothetical protein
VDVFIAMFVPLGSAGQLLVALTTSSREESLAGRYSFFYVAQVLHSS